MVRWERGRLTAPVAFPPVHAPQPSGKAATLLGAAAKGQWTAGVELRSLQAIEGWFMSDRHFFIIDNGECYSDHALYFVECEHSRADVEAVCQALGYTLLADTRPEWVSKDAGTTTLEGMMSREAIERFKEVPLWLLEAEVVAAQHDVEPIGVSAGTSRDRAWQEREYAMAQARLADLRKLLALRSKGGVR